MITAQPLSEIFNILGHDGTALKHGVTQRFTEQEMIYLLMKKKIKCYLYHRQSVRVGSKELLYHENDYYEYKMSCIVYHNRFFERILEEEDFKILFSEKHAWVEYFGKVYDPGKEEIVDVDKTIYNQVEGIIVIREKV